MKKCIIMFVLFVAALVMAVYSDSNEKEESEKDVALDQSIHSSDLAHQTETEAKIDDGVSPYVQVADNQ